MRTDIDTSLSVSYLTFLSPLTGLLYNLAELATLQVLSANQAVRTSSIVPDALGSIHTAVGGLRAQVFNVKGTSLVPHIHPQFEKQCAWCDRTAQQQGVPALLKCSRCKVHSPRLCLTLPCAT